MAKFQGFFSLCNERAWTSKDGSKSGKSAEGVFVAGQDTYTWDTWHDAAWCKEHGIHTGAAGEVTLAFSVGEYNGKRFQRVSLLGFSPLEQKEEPVKAEGAVDVTPQEKTPEMQAAAAEMMAKAQAELEAGANTNLPF